MKRSAGFLLRAIWSGIDALSTPITSFLVTAGLIRALGPEAYGSLVIAMAASTFALAVGTGIGFTTTKLIAEQTRAPDPSALSRSMAASLLTMGFIATLLLCVTSVWLDSATTLVFGPTPPETHALNRTVLLLSATAMALLQMEMVISAGLKGLEQFKTQAITEGITRVLISASMVAAGWVSGDITDVLVTQCILLMVSITARSLVLRTRMPGRKLLNRPRMADFRRLLGFGSWMWITSISTAAFGTMDRIVIGRLLGSSAAAEFQIYLQLSQLIHTIPTNLFAFSFPAFSRLSACGKSGRQEARRLFFWVLSASALLCVMGGSTFIIGRDFLVGLLAGNALSTASPQSFNLLVLTFASLALNIAPHYYLFGCGKAKIASMITLASGGAALVATFLLVPSLGLVGASVARLCYSIGAMMLAITSLRLLMKEFPSPVPGTRERNL